MTIYSANTTKLDIMTIKVGFNDDDCGVPQGSILGPIFISMMFKCLRT